MSSSCPLKLLYARPTPPFPPFRTTTSLDILLHYIREPTAAANPLRKHNDRHSHSLDSQS